MCWNFKKEKTIKLTYSYIASLLSLVCIQYLFIKIFGVVGIPIGTAINYTILIFIIMFFSEKLWPVGFSICRLLLQIFFGFSFVILFAFTNISSSLLYTVSLTVITVLMLLIVTVSKDDIIKLKFLFDNLKVKKNNKIFQLNNER